MTSTRASIILNVHPNTLRRWADAGQVPVYRIGQRRDRRFRLTDILAYLEGRNEDST